MCSTPFGIKEFCTCAAPRSNRADRAQRLSASKSSAQICPNRPRHQDLCSTPFGIKEFCTSRSSIRTSRAVCSTPFGIKEFCTRFPPQLDAIHPDVLNAFRHQRVLHKAPAIMRIWMVSCSTPFGIKEFCTRRFGPKTDSSPRFTCSTPFGIKEFCTCGAGAGTSPIDRGAQRLSASKSSALVALHHAFADCARQVLNAFRHQRVLHIGRQRRLAAVVVLNAFRHQRVLHRMGFTPPSPAVECSTPFGIKEFCTGLAATPGACCH